MTKKDLIEVLVKDLDYSYKRAAELVDIFFETMKAEIGKSGKLKLSGFGSFEVYHKKERLGRNLKTMETAKIKARNVIRFKESSILRKSINR